MLLQSEIPNAVDVPRFLADVRDRLVMTRAKAADYENFRGLEAKDFRKHRNRVKRALLMVASFSVKDSQQRQEALVLLCKYVAQFEQIVEWMDRKGK